MNELISVIIPIYQVEEYLTECLNSIVNQSYKNLEILIINDGSTDDSLKIAEDFAAKDMRIKIISQKNQGLAVARNTGLANFQGSYVMFVDSDDILQTSFVAHLYEAIKDYRGAFSVCQFSRKLALLGKGEKKENIKSGVITGNFSKKLKALQEVKFPSVTAWGKLYCRELFDKIRYPEIQNFEDGPAMLELISEAEVIVKLDFVGYYYRLNAASITGQKISQKSWDILAKTGLELDFVFRKHPEALSLVQKLCLNDNDYIMRNCVNDSSDLAEQLFKKLFAQNQMLSKSLRERQWLYSKASIYRLLIKVTNLIYEDSFARTVAKKILS